MSDLTTEQQQVIHDLRAEIQTLDLQADEAWAKYVKTGDRECFDTAAALDSEIEMKGLIAYIPKAGEKRIGRIREAIAKVKQAAGVDCPECVLPKQEEARIQALDTINAWRDELGLPSLDRLPQGNPGDAHECTIARAFQLGWEDTDKRLDGVNISSAGDAKVEFYDEEGRFVEFYFTTEKDHWVYDKDDEEGELSWDVVINAFDDMRYLDLVDTDSLIQRVLQWAYDSREIREEWVRELFNRGDIGQMVREVNARAHERQFTYSEGKLELASRVWDENASEWGPYEVIDTVLLVKDENSSGAELSKA